MEKTGSQDPIALNLLAMAYASNHNYEEAIMTGQQAMEIASAAGVKELADFISRQIETYAELLEEEDGGGGAEGKGD